MFKARKTRIIFQPEAEAVKAPVLELPTIEEPEVVIPEEVVGINSAAVLSRQGIFSLGKVTDYDGKEYMFLWDIKGNRLAKLTGEKVSDTTWKLTSEFLSSLFIPLEPPKLITPPLPAPKVEEPIIQKTVEEIKQPEPELEEPPLEDLDLSDDDIFANAQRFLETGISQEQMEMQ